MYEQNLEQPVYVIIDKDDAFELGDYPVVLVAETAAIGERSSALSEGFKRLAGYIFGNQQETIAVTTPVLSDNATGAWRTRFVMRPSRYTLAMPPDIPDGVTAVKLPARRLAAVRFAK